jgi:hypothetical protein
MPNGSIEGPGKAYNRVRDAEIAEAALARIARTQEIAKIAASLPDIGDCLDKLGPTCARRLRRCSER